MRESERRQALETHLQGAMALPVPCRIVAFDRMSMGQSRAMYRVVLEYANAAGCGPPVQRCLVVRVEQWGLLGTSSRDEVRVMRALHAAGQPVAKVLLYEPSEQPLGQPFFVMELAPGTSVFARESLDEYVAALDQLHRLDVEAAGLAFLPRPSGPRDAALDQVERWYQVYRWGLVGEPSPLLEEAAQWLRRHAPESSRSGLVHGDPGPGNYLHVGGRLSCLVDWEFAHLGDPDEDWAYLICMRGMGVMGESAWIDYLRERVGVVLEPRDLFWWQALNLFKGACIDQTALKTYMNGDNLAPNMLAIGTAVHLSALKRLSGAIAAARA